MKQARIAVLAVTLAVPILVWTLVFVFTFLPQVSEIESGTSAEYTRILDKRLRVWLVTVDQKRLEDLAHDIPSKVDPYKSDEFYKRCASELLPARRSIFDERFSDEAVPLCAWKYRIEQKRDKLPPEIQTIVAESKQEAKGLLVSKFLNDGFNATLIVGATFLMAVGLTAVWIMSPGQARQRIRMIAQVAIAGWTMFVAYDLATGTWDRNYIGAALTRAIALWVVGMVPCLLALYWTRPLKQ
jgi:hypothetical protein